MSSFIRSEEMALCQLFLQSEASYACISELGELGLVQFRDLNPNVTPFQRKFVNEVRRCDEMERKLRYIEREIKKDGIPILDTGENPEAPGPRKMIDLEASFEKLETELKEVNGNAEALRKNFLELTELKHILRKTQSFFAEVDKHPNENGKPQPGTSNETTSLLGPAVGDEYYGTRGREQLGIVVQMGPLQTMKNASNGFISGVILREKMPAFERMLWRACRGNVFLRQSEIETPLEDPVSGEEVRKSVFVVFFQGEQLKTRVKKICEGFRAHVYPCPDSATERREMDTGVMTRIEDLNTILSQTTDHRHRVLVEASKNIKQWFIKACKIKAIYHTLNMFNLDVTQKCLIGECWSATGDLEKIQQALQRGTEVSGSHVPSILNRMATVHQPPTYNRTNKFTQVFQNIVNAYGVSTYREVNPAPFSIITFPFLFSVMFGDFGHGFIMFLFGLWMVVKEKQLIAKKINDEIWKMFFGGRYIIMMMGLFSVYSGLVYNDIFSKSVNIFGSAWSVNSNGSFLETASYTLSPDYTKGDYSNTPYPFGVDPIWAISMNKITFNNSFKQKISVIFGVSQMFLGIVLGIFNHLYFQKYSNVVTQTVPMLLFLGVTFGYLCVLIFAKWLTFNAYQAHIYTGVPPCAPKLLIGLINMYLMKYPKPEKMIPGTPTYVEGCNPQGTWFAGQEPLQYALVALAVICIPWLLLGKPIVMKIRGHFKKQVPNPYPVNTVGEEEEIIVQDELAANYEPNEAVVEAPGGHDDEEHTTVVGQGSDRDSIGDGPSEGLGPQNGRTGAEAGPEHLDRQESRLLGEDYSQSTTRPADAKVEEDEMGFGDIMVHQAIHTIEFCLGCISHTASYLRLWALSLAHGQLSEVLWTMVMRQGLSQANSAIGGIVTFAVFTGWAVLTIGVLLLMEGLSAFLHTLRLHWVEFQSKFYGGDGYKFIPFCFEDILAEKASETDE